MSPSIPTIDIPKECREMAKCAEHNSTLGRLPVELLLIIFGYTNFSDQKAISGTCILFKNIVSKHNHFISRRQLYQSFSLDFSAIANNKFNAPWRSTSLFPSDGIHGLCGSDRCLDNWFFFREDYFVRMLGMGREERSRFRTTVFTTNHGLDRWISRDMAMIDEAVTDPFLLGTFLQQRMEQLHICCGKKCDEYGGRFSWEEGGFSRYAMHYALASDVKLRNEIEIGLWRYWLEFSRHGYTL